MKKISFLLAAIAATLVQAQTVKVSAPENNSKVVQISINLDSLKGKTMVATVNDAVLNIAFDGTGNAEPSDVISREDSSEKADTTDVAPEGTDVEPEDTDVAPEGIDVAPEGTDVEPEGTEVTPEDPQPPSGSSSPAEAALDALGLSTVTSFISGFIGKEGEQYMEYQAEKMVKDLTEVDSSKFIPEYPKRKWKWLNNISSYSTLEASGIFGKNYGSDDDEGAENINEEDYGSDTDSKMNIGGSLKFSQVFVKGRYNSDGSFTPNPLNFAWSIGGLVAFDHEEDYGWSSDILAKVGIQAGSSITLGIDALFGAGTTPYKIYSSDGIDYRVIVHNQWCFKYGLQAWISMNYGNNTYTSLFARLVSSVEPGSLNDHPTAPMWENTYIDFDDGSWRAGFAVGYKFGAHADVKSKRLRSTTSVGYILTGIEKNPRAFYALEKFTQVKENLDFSYGIEFGRSLGGHNLESLCLTGGWIFKLKPTQKLSYLAKFYAGAGEYMVSKHCVSRDRNFDLAYTNIEQVCITGGIKLGMAYKFGCNIISACLRGGYHYGFDTTYEGFDDAKSDNLKGVDLVPSIGYSINF